MDALFEGKLPKPRRTRLKNAPPKPDISKAAARRQAKKQAAEYLDQPLMPLTESESNFRHGHWRERRAIITRHLAACGTSSRTLERWDCCGSDAWLYFNPSLNRYRINASYCKNRHCEPCMRAKANKLASNLRAKLKERSDAGKKYRFITLSMAHTDKPLTEQIKRMYACFKKLRATKAWKTSQHGGCFTAEIKWEPDSPSNKTRVQNGDRPLWHPHLHIISEGTFLHQVDLSELWRQITGDSFIVHIRMLEDAKEAAFYLSKYVTKSTNAAVWKDNEAASEWICASRGLRSAATFGNWRGFALLKNPPIDPGWERQCSMDALIARAARGELHAQNVLLILRPPGNSDSPAWVTELPGSSHDPPL